MVTRVRDGGGCGGVGEILGDGTALYFNCGGGCNILPPVYGDKTAQKHTHMNNCM